MHIVFPALFRNCLEHMIIQALNEPDPSAVTNFYFCVNLPGNRPDAVGSGDTEAGLTLDICQAESRDAQFIPHSCNSAFQNRKMRHGHLRRDSRVVQLKLTDWIESGYLHIITAAMDNVSHGINSVVFSCSAVMWCSLITVCFHVFSLKMRQIFQKGFLYNSLSLFYTLDIPLCL